MIRRITHSPYLQGELDGLCGLYAVINACLTLCPELDDDLAHAMFRRAVKALTAHDDAMSLSVLYEGIDFPTLTSVTRSVVSWLEKRTGISVHVSSFERRPKSAPRMGTVWREIGKLTEANAVIVTALIGVHNHWTTIVGADDRKLLLSDSDDLVIIPRHRCTLRLSIDKHILAPGEMLVLHRAAQQGHLTHPGGD